MTNELTVYNSSSRDLATNRKLLNSPFLEDVPRAFFFMDNQGKNHCLGPYLQTIWNFAFYYNMELNLDKVDNMPSGEVYCRIQNAQYNISLNGGILNMSNRPVIYSYPTEWVKKCIMVPLEDELPKYWYVVWPYGRYIWALGFISALLIAILMRYFNFPKRRGKHSVIRHLLYSSAIFLYCSNMNVRMANASLRVQIFYGWLMIIGFILSAFYLPYLTSYNMKPIFLPAINTLDELLKAKIQVVIPSNDLEELRVNTLVDQSTLEPILHGLTHKHFQNLIKNFNRTFAYVVSQDQWSYLNRQQRNLIKPYFHLSSICFGAVFTSFPMQVESSYRDTLNIFIMRVHETGF